MIAAKNWNFLKLATLHRKLQQIEQALRLVHTDQLANFYARINRVQLGNSLSYCLNACILRRSERAFKELW